jgi:hypothetical protein
MTTRNRAGRRSAVGRVGEANEPAALASQGYAVFARITFGTKASSRSATASTPVRTPDARCSVQGVRSNLRDRVTLPREISEGYASSAPPPS